MGGGAQCLFILFLVSWFVWLLVKYAHRARGARPKERTKYAAQGYRMAEGVGMVGKVLSLCLSQLGTDSQALHITCILTLSSLHVLVHNSVVCKCIPDNKSISLTERVEATTLHSYSALFFYFFV